MSTVLLENGNEGWLAASNRIDAIWDSVRPLLAKAIEFNRGEFGLEEIKFNLEFNKNNLWCVSKGDKIRAALVTEICSYPRFNSLNILLMGGEATKEWSALFPMLEHFARLYNCQFIEGLTRPGMARLLNLGFKEQYRLISYRVSDTMTQ